MPPDYKTPDFTSLSKAVKEINDKLLPAGAAIAEAFTDAIEPLNAWAESIGLAFAALPREEAQEMLEAEPNQSDLPPAGDVETIRKWLRK